MAKKNGGFLSTVGIVAGTAVLSVVATRLFDKYLAERVGLGPDGKKALPAGDSAQEGEPGPQTAHNPTNPYLIGGLLPLPPPMMVPTPVMQMPGWGSSPWAQQPQRQPARRNPRAPAQLEVVKDEPDETEENVSAFLEGLEEA